MRPRYIDELGWAIAEVYDGVTDRILLNLARYFPYIHKGREPKDAFEYQVKMLAQMGQINRETRDIIAQSLGGADDALREALNKAIMDALRNEEPALREAARKGLTSEEPPEPELNPGQMQAFTSYYNQAADKLNYVNTVMLESTQAAYRSTVSDIVARVQRTQTIVNTAAGEVVTGTSAWNTAMHDAVQKMVDNGLTGFVDHAGRHWSPEAYVAMDVRTTLHNTANAAIWERADEYGADIYQVSSHNGARPLCFPWQAKLISRTNTPRDVPDLDGNMVHVYAEYETSKGEPAGLFGINCGHYPMTFIPGFSTLKGTPQDEEANEKTYAESQQQRALERDLRQERLKLETLKAQGATAEEIDAQKAKVNEASDKIQDFCDETGRARRRNREYTPINATFPPDDSYDPTQFPTETRDRMADFFGNNPPDDNPPPSPVHIGPDDIQPQGGVQIDVTGEQEKPLDRSLGEAYEYHRQTHNLNLVEYDPTSENQFITVDMNGMSESAKGTAESTLSELAQKYDTTLQAVRTMTPDEIREAGGGIACVRHDYRLDDSTMLINQSKCGDQEALNEIVRRNVEKGFFATVPEDMYDRYVYTHEFGHTLINTSIRLDNKTNFAGADYDEIKRIRREITDLYEEYTAEVAELERKARENGLLFEQSDFDQDLYYEGIRLNKELKRITLSEYSLTNANEFFAESFVYTELGGTENPYAMRMRSIIDKYFRR